MLQQLLRNAFSSGFRPSTTVLYSKGHHYEKKGKKPELGVADHRLLRCAETRCPWMLIELISQHSINV